MASKQTAEYDSFSDLAELHSAYCNVLSALLSEKSRPAADFNYHADRLLRAFANTRALVNEVEPKLAARRDSPVRFRSAVASGCYVRLVRDVALNVVKIVEGYWRELHGGRITPATKDPRFEFTSEHLAELTRRFDESKAFRSSGDPERRWSEIRAALGETLVGLKQEAAWLDEQEVKGAPEATASKRKRGRPSTAERDEARLMEYERGSWRSVAAFARDSGVDPNTMEKSLQRARAARETP